LRVSRLYEGVACEGESLALSARLSLAGAPSRLLVLAAGFTPRWGFLDARSILEGAESVARRLASSCGDCSFLVEAPGGVFGRGARVRGWLWGREARVEAGSSSARYGLGRPHGPVGYESFTATLRGRRKANEDSSLVASMCVGDARVRMLAVADGAGGLGGGDVASILAVTAFLASTAGLLAAGARPEDAIIEALEDAGAVVAGHVARTGKRIASTLAAVAVTPGGRAYYASVGDSPVVLVDPKGARVVSRVQRIDRPGGGSALTSYLGGPMDISSGAVTLEPPAILVVESDGVYEYIEPSELTLHPGASADTIAWWLVEEALRRGSSDNVTAAVGVVRTVESEG